MWQATERRCPGKSLGRLNPQITQYGSESSTSPLPPTTECSAGVQSTTRACTRKCTQTQTVEHTHKQKHLRAGTNARTTHARDRSAAAGFLGGSSLCAFFFIRVCWSVGAASCCMIFWPACRPVRFFSLTFAGHSVRQTAAGFLGCISPCAFFFIDVCGSVGAASCCRIFEQHFTPCVFFH